MTGTLEDYLEMVSFLADEGSVRVTDIASRLNVSKPSVLASLKALEEKGLIAHERYSTVALTETGEAAAQEIRQKHDFLTAFFRDLLGVSAQAAEEDACKMEHLLSAETYEKMKAYVEKKSGQSQTDN